MMKKNLVLSSFILLVGIISVAWVSNPMGVPTVGDKAVDLKFLNPEGKEMALSDLEGHVVLLDFWASWCGPCRRANPHVVGVYEEYKDKKFIKGTEGFTVFSVSLDQDKNRWIAAIEKDNLSWDYHVSDLKGWRTEAGKPYGIRSIPTTYLMDEEGYIIARNPSPAVIKMELDKRLKKKK